MFLKRSHRDLSIAIKKFQIVEIFFQKMISKFLGIFRIFLKFTKKIQKLTKKFKNPKTKIFEDQKFLRSKFPETKNFKIRNC